MHRAVPNSNSNAQTTPHHFHSTPSSNVDFSYPISTSTINPSCPSDAKFEVFPDINVEFDPSERGRGRGIAPPKRPEVPTAAARMATVAATDSSFWSQSRCRAGEVLMPTLIQGGGAIEPDSKSSTTQRLKGSDYTNKYNQNSTRCGPPPYPKTFWEGELAALRETEDDDYTWYYRNPHRHMRRPRNFSASTRLRVYNRRRMMMCGGVETEEGLPTKMNRRLFLEYVGRHYGVETFEAEVEERSKEVVKVVRESGAVKEQARKPAGSGGDILVNHNDTTSSPVEDWQEELFSTKYSHRRFRCAPPASSIESYTSSDRSSSPALPSSPRTSYEMDADYPSSWFADFSEGGLGGSSSKKTCFDPSSMMHVGLFSQVSFLRVTST